MKFEINYCLYVILVWLLRLLRCPLVRTMKSSVRR